MHGKGFEGTVTRLRNKRYFVISICVINDVCYHGIKWEAGGTLWSLRNKRHFVVSDFAIEDFTVYSMPNHTQLFTNFVKNMNVRDDVLVNDWLWLILTIFYIFYQVSNS